MTSQREGHKGNREGAKTADAVGNVKVGWDETPEKLGRQVSKMEVSSITVMGVPGSCGRIDQENITVKVTSSIQEVC